MDNTKAPIVALAAGSEFGGRVAKAIKAAEEVEVVRLRRRQARATLTRKKILEAATKEFSSLGFEGATTRSIATAADVPHALVVYHFETKLGVWRAVMETALQDFHDELDKRVREMEGHDDVTILRETMRMYIRLSAQRPELNWLVSHEAGGSDRLQWLLENVLDHDIAKSVRLIGSAQRAGRFVPGDPAHLHFLWLGAAARIFNMPAEVERNMGCSATDPDFVERHVRLCESLFFIDPPESK